CRDRRPRAPLHAAGALVRRGAPLCLFAWRFVPARVDAWKWSGATVVPYMLLNAALPSVAQNDVSIVSVRLALGASHHGKQVGAELPTARIRCLPSRFMLWSAYGRRRVVVQDRRSVYVKRVADVQSHSVYHTARERRLVPVG